MGHISVKEAFLGPLQEAFRRARVASIPRLTIADKVQFLKVWVLPTLLLTARAYVADWSIISAARQVYHVFFGFDSWGSPPTSYRIAEKMGGMSSHDLRPGSKPKGPWPVFNFSHHHYGFHAMCGLALNNFVCAMG